MHVLAAFLAPDQARVSSTERCLEIAGWDISDAKRCVISPAVMSVLDRYARMRRRGAEERASKILSADISVKLLNI